MKWLRFWPWRNRPVPVARDTSGQARQVRAALDAQRAEVDQLARDADYFREAVEDALRRTR